MSESQAGAAAAPADLEYIRGLLTDFAWHADRGDGEALGRLFMPDGVLRVGGQDYAGREQVARDCLRRAAIPGRKTRHLWSNLRVERAGADLIATTAIQLTFEQLGDPDSVSTQLRVNDVFDTFMRDASGEWRFAARRIERAMGPAL